MDSGEWTKVYSWYMRTANVSWFLNGNYLFKSNKKLQLQVNIYRMRSCNAHTNIKERLNNTSQRILSNIRSNSSGRRFDRWQQKTAIFWWIRELYFIVSDAARYVLSVCAGLLLRLVLANYRLTFKCGHIGSHWVLRSTVIVVILSPPPQLQQ